MRSTKLLDLAWGVALGRLDHKQTFRLGAVGLRSDGKLVASFNGAPKEPEWKHHSETRLARKLTPNSTVAVVRILADGTWALAKPCNSCETCLRRVGVKRVYYSISLNEFGVLVW